MRWMMYRWWCEGGGDRAWWVIESVFLRSPDKGFWACLGDIPPDMPRRPETWVSLCYLMLKLCGISRSSAILGSDSPQSNNRKDHSLWVTPFIPREWPNVKHAIAGYLRLPRPTSAPALMRVLHWLRCWVNVVWLLTLEWSLWKGKIPYVSRMHNITEKEYEVNTWRQI